LLSAELNVNVGSRFDTTNPLGTPVSTPGVTVTFTLEEARIKTVKMATIVRLNLVRVRRS
jgi:hypothetical protein